MNLVLYDSFPPHTFFTLAEKANIQLFMQLSLEHTAAMTMLESQILCLKMVSWLPKLIPLYMIFIMASQKTATCHVLKCKICDHQVLFSRVCLSMSMSMSMFMSMSMSMSMNAVSVPFSNYQGFWVIFIFLFLGKKILFDSCKSKRTVTKEIEFLT